MSDSQNRTKRHPPFPPEPEYVDDPKTIHWAFYPGAYDAEYGGTASMDLNELLAEVEEHESGKVIIDNHLEIVYCTLSDWKSWPNRTKEKQIVIAVDTRTLPFAIYGSDSQTAREAIEDCFWWYQRRKWRDLKQQRGRRYR